MTSLMTQLKEADSLAQQGEAAKAARILRDVRKALRTETPNTRAGLAGAMASLARRLSN